MARSRDPRRLKDVTARTGGGAAVLLAAVALVAIARFFPADALSQTPKAGDARLQPSGEGLPFDPGRYRDFDDYLGQTHDRLDRRKVYLDPRRKGTELASATPFELPPADDCAQAKSARPRRGILLLHGLADIPLAMRDLAGAFAAHCFLVRVMLLPGHGARAGDLLTVTRGDWLAAAWFGVKEPGECSSYPEAEPLFLSFGVTIPTRDRRRNPNPGVSASPSATDLRQEARAAGTRRAPAYPVRARSASPGPRSRISAPMLSATRAEDALIESRARCAYCEVVSTLLCPNSFLNIDRLSPRASALLTNECLWSCSRTSGNSARSRTRSQ